MVNFEERIKNLTDQQKSLLAQKLNFKDKNRDSPGEKKRLVAYLIEKDKANKEELREFLKGKLPEYMIPGNFIGLESFPTLPNGKIDINSLSLPEKTEVTDSGYIAPRTDTEKQLVDIWEDVLGFEPVGIDDNFFEIGGDSILSIQIIARARKIDLQLAPAQILQYPTIRGLAEFIREEESEKSLKSLVPIRASGSKPPVFCTHAGGGHVLFYKTLTDYLDKEQPVYGIQPLGLDEGELPHKSVEEMAAYYLTEIKQIQPAGPYLLLGYCFSNAVCIEMAKQLEKMGESNFKVIIVDAHPANLPFSKMPVMPTSGEKLYSYYLLLKQRDWNELYERFITKAFVTKLKIKKKLGIQKDKVDEQEDNLKNVYRTLAKILANYQWKSFDFKVTLVLAGNFEIHPWARAVVASWEIFARNGLEYIFTPGSHMSLFDEPAVHGLGKTLQEILDEDLKINVETSSE